MALGVLFAVSAPPPTSYAAGTVSIWVVDPTTAVQGHLSFEVTCADEREDSVHRARVSQDGTTVAEVTSDPTNGFPGVFDLDLRWTDLPEPGGATLHVRCENGDVGTSEVFLIDNRPPPSSPGASVTVEQQDPRPGRRAIFRPGDEVPLTVVCPVGSQVWVDLVQDGSSPVPYDAFPGVLGRFTITLPADADLRTGTAVIDVNCQRAGLPATVTATSIRVQA